MTRRVWIPLAALVVFLFGVGVWAVGVVRELAGLAADAINGRTR